MVYPYRANPGPSKLNWGIAGQEVKVENVKVENVKVENAKVGNEKLEM